MARQCLVIGGVFAAWSLPVRSVILSAIPPQMLRRQFRAASSSGFENGTKALESLWEGADFRNDSYSFRFLSPKKNVRQEKMKAEKSVHVLGLQHTGTNLLSAMLYLNFGNKLNYADVGPTPNPNVSALWRHANIKEVFAQDRDLIEKFGGHSSAITMIRDPFSWLQMVHEYPFELKSCVYGPDWLTKKCVHSSPGGRLKHKFLPKEYNTLTGVWNQWTDGYLNAAGFGFPDRQVIRYEDLVSNPDKVMDQVANFLGMKKPGMGWTQLSISPEGENLCRIKANKNLHRQTYIDFFPELEQRKVCHFLDPVLKATYDYAKVCDGLEPWFENSETE